MSINAPEIGLCSSQESTDKLTSLISGKKVRLEGDINDHFGRFLALVYVDDILINEQMILSGWARFTSTASSKSEILKAAFQKTKDSKLGVFSNQCLQLTNPINPKCNIKGNVKDGKKTYFFAGCGNYSNVALEIRPRRPMVLFLDHCCLGRFHQVRQLLFQGVLILKIFFPNIDKSL